MRCDYYNEIAENVSIDGTVRHCCGNCYRWRTSKERCLIHRTLIKEAKKEVKVAEEMDCVCLFKRIAPDYVCPPDCIIRIVLKYFSD